MVLGWAAWGGAAWPGDLGVERLAVSARKWPGASLIGLLGACSGGDDRYDDCACGPFSFSCYCVVMVPILDRLIGIAIGWVNGCV